MDCFVDEKKTTCGPCKDSGEEKACDVCLIYGDSDGRKRQECQEWAVIYDVRYFLIDATGFKCRAACILEILCIVNIIRDKMKI